MSQHYQAPYVADRKSVTDAAELIDRFGTLAVREASARARASRQVGNYVHFCHWRQIERLVALLSQHRSVGTIH